MVERGIGKNRFRLAVITEEEGSLVAMHFKHLEKCVKVRDTQLLSDALALKRHIEQIDTRFGTAPSMVVYSASTGQGKSHWVQSQAAEIVKFQLSGDLHVETICRSLLDSLREHSALHLVLSYVTSEQTLNDIITDLCLLRTLRAGHLVVTVPTTCRIFVEVQNLQPPLSLPFLSYLHTQKVHFDLSSLQLSAEIHFVVAYLHLYDTNQMMNGKVEEVQVNKDMALRLLAKYYLEPQKERGEQSFQALHSFVRVMAVLLRHLECSPFTQTMIDLMINDALAAGAPQLVPEYHELRKGIVKSFLQTCTEVNTRCISAVRSENPVPGYECKLRWDDSNHFCMLFLGDGSHVVIYRSLQDIPTAVQKLLFIQQHCHEYLGLVMVERIAKKPFDLRDYSNLKHEQALEYLQTYAPPGVHLVQQYCHSEYVLTSDNFLKMNLTYLRAMAKLPVVIMGETGCGKTSLIRFFVQEVLREPLVIVNIHAGIAFKQLSDHVAAVFQAAEKASSRLWVFFDEFNTSECVGHVCEILCERSFCGKQLPDNIVLLAACNPHRVRTLRTDDEVGIKKSARYAARAQLNLVHEVKPLPEAVLQHIWDFGALAANDCRKYVAAMLRKMCSPQLERLFTHLVCCSQQYFQTHEDVSSVSLRDVARFLFLYQWFETSLSTRKTMRDDRFKRNCEKYHLSQDWTLLDHQQLCAGVLALCCCYYYRLARQEQRQEYLSHICEQSSGQITVETTERVLRSNEDDFLGRMELPEATAVNRAFRENVSCLLHCIFCKIPLFICGKPGCSKSLAVQLVFSNLRGSKSSDPYFRTLPELVIVPFQGSESCTSEGIQKVFDRAKRFLSKETPNLLPVVVFDEIGLAEISKNNPLKVLHSLLEQENRCVGFVGVSNWRLDASKMNRALYLAHPEPHLKELIFTGKSIYKACKGEVFPKEHRRLMKVLATAYYEYKAELKHTKYAEFFGLRDFYCLVKQASLRLQTCTSDPAELFALVKIAVERNFGGKKEAASRVLKLIIQKCPEFEEFEYLRPTASTELLALNSADPHSRYLMLLCKGDVATYVVDHVQKQLQRRLLVGSHMFEDESREEYAFRSLSDIILYMEKGIPIILKDMDHIYTSLYDLFNQNFAVSGDRRYCRVALGAQFNPRCFVHKDFRVTVFLSDDEDVLEQTDAPFLNRFEKHRFDIEQLLKPFQKIALHQAEEWANSLMRLASGRNPRITLNHVFPLYSKDYLKLLVLFLDSKDSLLDKCKRELLRMASQEVLLLAQAGQLDPEDQTFVHEVWTSFHTQSCLHYLSHFASGQVPYSKGLVFLYDSNILQAEQLAKFPVKTYYQHFSVFTQMVQVVEDLKSFCSTEDKLYLLDLNMQTDGANLVMLKFLVDKAWKELRDPEKRICLLVRLKRNIPVSTEVCWFEEWDLRTFSLCRDSDFALSQHLLSLTCADIIRTTSLFDFTASIGKLTLEAYQKFEIGGVIKSAEQVNNYILGIVEQVSYSPRLVQALQLKLASLLPSKSWVDEVLCKPECATKATNLPTAIQTALELELAMVYPNLLFAVEKCAAFHSYFAQGPDTDLLQQIWVDVLQELECSRLMQTLKKSNELYFRLLPEFPFIVKEYEFLTSIAEESKELPEDKGRDYFLKKFGENSVLRHHYDSANASRSLPSLYFRELIRVELAQSDLQTFEELLYLLQQCWSRHCLELVDKVWVYCCSHPFHLALCDLVLALQQLQLDFLPSPTQQLSEFLCSSGSAEAACALLKDFFERAVSALSGSLQWLESTSLPQAMLLLSKVFNAVVTLDSVHSFSLDCYDELDILSLSFQAISPSPNALDVLQRIQEKAAAVTEGSFLYDDTFSQCLIESILQFCQLDEANRVIAVYLRKLLTHSESACLPMVIALIDNPDRHLWPFSSAIVFLVAELSGLASEEAVVEISECDFVNTLEAELSRGAGKTRFSVLLCDVLVSHMKSVLSTSLLSTHLSTFYGSLQLLNDPHIKYPTLGKIQACAFLRCYLEAYCKAVHEEASDTCLRSVTEALNEDFPTLRVYALKYWHRSEELSFLLFQQAILERPTVTWTKHFTFHKEFHELFPYLQTPLYQRATEALLCIANREDPVAFSHLVDAVHSVEEKVALGAAVLQVVSLRGTYGEDNSSLTRVMTAGMPLLRQRLGNALAQVLLRLSTNLPEDSCLKLKDMRTTDMRRAHSLWFALVILCSVKSPLTNWLLDDEGNIRANVQVVARESYICGVGIKPQLVRFQSQYESIASAHSTYLENPVPTCGCGFVDFTASTLVCPFCSRALSEITFKKAVELIREKLERYQKDPEKGFWAFSGGDASSKPFRGIEENTHRLLHLFTTLLLRFLSLAGLLSAACLIQSPQPVSPSYLEEQITADFASITQKIGEGIQIWWFAVMKQLPRFLQQHQQGALTLEGRRKFEGSVNSYLQPFWERPSPCIEQERASMAVGGLDAIAVLEETAPLSQLPLLHYFRVTRLPDLPALEAYMSERNLSEQFPLLWLFLHRRSDFESVRQLPPLVQFLNHLQSKFDHKVRRAEARTKRLEEVLREDPRVKQLFLACTAVWTWLSTQHSRTFTQSDEVQYFLVDEQEQYMAAALLALAERQNALVNEFLTAMQRKLKLPKEQILNLRKVSVQTLKPEQVLCCTLDSFELSYVNHPAYGRGGEILFNCPRLEEKIQSCFEKVRLVSGDLEFVHYQFEMLNSSSTQADLVSKVRAQIPQRPLEEQQVAAVKGCLGRQGPADLGMHYESLTTLLCFLSNSPVSPTTSIMAFANQIERSHLSEIFTQDTTLSQVAVQQSIALYELIEDILFVYSRQYVRPEFNDKSSFTGKELAGIAASSKLQQVMRRLIQRLLIADIDSSQSLSLYVRRPDFWPEDTPEQEIESFAMKLQHTTLACALPLYEWLEQKGREKVFHTAAPVKGKKAGARDR